MATVKIYNQEKKEVGEMDLAPEVFEVEVRPELLHQAVRAHLAAKRVGTVGVKTRSMARGGGHKPWRQKGTGRARAGTIRSPLWTGGGVAHGPKMRDYSFKLNKKVRRLALRMALTSRFVDNGLLVLDKIEISEIKTRHMVKVADSLGLKKCLIVVDEPDNILSLSARNIPGVKVVTENELSVYEVLRHPQLVMVSGAVDKIQKRLL